MYSLMNMRGMHAHMGHTVTLRIISLFYCPFCWCETFTNTHVFVACCNNPKPRNLAPREKFNHYHAMNGRGIIAMRKAARVAKILSHARWYSTDGRHYLCIFYFISCFCDKDNTPKQSGRGSVIHCNLSCLNSQHIVIDRILYLLRFLRTLYVWCSILQYRILIRIIFNYRFFFFTIVCSFYKYFHYNLIIYHESWRA